MATIYGRHYGSYSTFADTLVGTDGNDYIYGLGGNDTLWGGLGSDRIEGGSGNDYIVAGNPTYYSATAAWGNDTVLGGTGDDTIDFVRTTSSVSLYGEDGVDLIFGGSAGDLISGGSGDDYLSGNGGADTIYGGSGVDDLFGGTGNDWLSGGTGGDYMTGGSGNDTFAFTFGETGLTWSVADTVRDFDRNYDWIDGPVDGTASNYREANVAYDSGFDGARAWAQGVINDTVRYAFASDGVNGYLFGDLNDDGWIDSGMELLGAGHLARFTYTDIV